MVKPLKDPKILKNIPLFQSLSSKELSYILNAPDNEIEEFEEKYGIIRESEVGNCMYVILEGHVEVSIRSDLKEVVIATLSVGDFFGEQSLLPWGTGRRNATVRSKGKTKVFRIDKKYVLLAIKRDKEKRAKASAGKSNLQKNQRLASPARSKEIAGIVKDMRLFRSLSELELATIDGWTEAVNFNPGDFIIKEFQKGECLYIILDGKAEVFALNSNGQEITLAELGTGKYFGEQALTPDGKGKRNAFVRAKLKTRVLKVPKTYFKLILARDRGANLA